MSTHVEILGPLGRENESFHVHAIGCRDIKSRRYADLDGVRAGYAWQAEVSTFREVVETIFSDFIFMNDEQPWTDYVQEVKVFPCVRGLTGVT